MSEWGNPTASGSDPCTREQTQGSETSQYLEEKKAISGAFCLIGYSLCEFHYGQTEGSCDSLNSGERNGNSPNRTCLHVRGCRAIAAFSCEELQNIYIKERVGKHDPRR